MDEMVSLKCQLVMTLELPEKRVSAEELSVSLACGHVCRGLSWLLVDVGKTYPKGEWYHLIDWAGGNGRMKEAAEHRQTNGQHGCTRCSLCLAVDMMIYVPASTSPH